MPVSVIVPVFNAERFLRRCIDSILAQSLPADEIIAVDDGSTDSSAAILRSYADQIRVISQANGGASSARNTGIKAASGSYIAFLDADDYWHPDKLKIQCHAMQSDSSLVATFARGAGHYRDAADTTPFDQISVSRRDLSEIFCDPYLGTSTFMILRDTLLRLEGFDESLTTAEDIDLYLRTAEIGAIGEIHAKLIHKEKLDDSLGGQLSSYQDNLYVVDRFMNRCENPDELQALVAPVKAKIYLDWARDLAWHGQTANSLARTFQHIGQSGSPRHIPSATVFVIRSLFRKRRS